MKNKLSFNCIIKNQLINTFVGAYINFGAQEIGKQYHTNGFSDNTFINKFTQLTLHAGLGAASNKLTGNDALSGAISGVSGEIFAEILGNSLYKTTDGNQLTKDQEVLLKEMGGLAGGLSALITGKLSGLDDKDIGNNMFAGQRVGSNAVENNLLTDQPLGDSKTTSEFVKNRKHPIIKKITNHKGIDTIPAEGNDNTTVHSLADGVSLGTYFQKNEETGTGWGNYVYAEYTDSEGNVYRVRYAHLQDGVNIAPGTQLKEGQPIGTMGATGGVAGKHLHLEVLKPNPAVYGGWEQVNPNTVKFGNYEYLKDVPGYGK